MIFGHYFLRWWVKECKYVEFKKGFVQFTYSDIISLCQKVFYYMAWYFSTKANIEGVNFIIYNELFVKKLHTWWISLSLLGPPIIKVRQGGVLTVTSIWWKFLKIWQLEPHLLRYIILKTSQRWGEFIFKRFDSIKQK